MQKENRSLGLFLFFQVSLQFETFPPIQTTGFQGMLYLQAVFPVGFNRNQQQKNQGPLLPAFLELSLGKRQSGKQQKHQKGVGLNQVVPIDSAGLYKRKEHSKKGKHNQPARMIESKSVSPKKPIDQKTSHRSTNQSRLPGMALHLSIGHRGFNDR